MLPSSHGEVPDLAGEKQAGSAEANVGRREADSPSKLTYSGRDLLVGGLCVALALVFPVFFHALGLGSAFLPMFYPILAAGFMTPPAVATAVGFLSPFVSAFLTGMPPFYPPLAPVMAAEGVVLGGLTSLLTWKLGWTIRPALAASLLAERLVLLAAVGSAARWLDLPAGFLGWASLIRSLPGIVMIFIILPPIVRRLRKRIASSPLID